MKKSIILLSVSAAMFFASCNMHKEELAQLTNEKDSLHAVVFEKDQAISDFLGSFTEIQSNLAEITEKEKGIAVHATGNPEAIRSSRDLIRSQIQDIKALMEESKNKISDLNIRLKKSNIKLEKFEQLIVSLNSQLAAKDSELTALNVQVATLNSSVETLRTSVTELTLKSDDQERELKDKTSKINTAYVAVGTFKKLNAQKVVAKEGGLLGIGKTEVLQPDVNTEAMNKVDITQVHSIPVNSKDAKLITAHPADSYTFEKDQNKISALVITDAGKFWSNSKYLVVVTN